MTSKSIYTGGVTHYTELLAQVQLEFEELS